MIFSAEIIRPPASFVTYSLVTCLPQSGKNYSTEAIVDDFPAKRFTLQGESKNAGLWLKGATRTIQIQQSYQRVQRRGSEYSTTTN
jgi:hypothetical protein